MDKINAEAATSANVCAAEADGKNISADLIDGVFGSGVWMSATEGYIQCPGKAKHTNQNGRRDCKIYLNGVPTIYCVHTSCRSAVEAANRMLRNHVLDGDQEQRKLTDKEKQRLRENERKENVRRRAACSKATLLQAYRWTSLSMKKHSPTPIPDDFSQHWRLLLSCFPDEGLVWIGATYDSGKPENSKNFRTAAEWLKEPKAPDQLICPSLFKTETFSRKNKNVISRPFLVVESDELSRDEVGAVFQWMEKSVGLNLRAIVDTAGKSLHAWFDYPDDSMVDELKLVLPELGCDPKLFTPSQPVRLPGALRDDKFQRLIYLNPEVKQ